MAGDPEKHGSARDFYFCADAHKTRDKVLARARNDRQLQRMVARIEALFETFVETGKIANPEHFNSEGDGFWGFKAYQLRAYGWYSKHLPQAFVISHFVIKKKDKLDPEDKDRMQRNRKVFEQDAGIGR